jgi:hypothetical protein
MNPDIYQCLYLNCHGIYLLLFIIEMTNARDIFIFGGGNKRLRNVTNLYCQCQISQRRS